MQSRGAVVDSDGQGLYAEVVGGDVEPHDAGLAVDGKAGAKTYASLGSHYVKRGEGQYLVSFVEVALSVLNYETGGIEFPGIFGSGLESAVTVFQRDAGLTADGVAGYRTLRALISKFQ